MILEKEVVEMIIENIKNNANNYDLMIDGIQTIILKNTNEFLLYDDCELIYNTVKGFM